ncbi:MAG TPA: response regulator [Thermoanaerobaculia bacterium]|jgi:CheY-like chemotaxis protein|nr:response regulator [Thermoanaerobaculia bacterium]
MKRRILLADDSVTIQKVIELTFMDEDYEVRAVSNGDEALALMSEMNPDFVIADVHMPGANGYEVCRRSKQLRPEAPVLLLVGTFEPFDEGQARSVGADSYLKKPFDSQELLQRVQELLAPQATPSAVPDLPLPLTAEPPPLVGPEGIPEFSAEPAWGNFELQAEPEPPFAAPPASPTPFDREPSFTLESDLSYEVESEPVFELDENEPPFTVQDEVFAAPGELSLDETRQDRYIPEEPVPAAAPSSGFEFPAAAPLAPPAAANGGARLSDEDVDRVARRVVELLGDKTVRDVAWEVIPDLAEVIIRDRLRELEAQVE